MRNGSDYYEKVRDIFLQNEAKKKRVRSFRFDSGVVIEVAWHYGRERWMATYETENFCIRTFNMRKLLALKYIRQDLVNRTVNRLNGVI